MTLDIWLDFILWKLLSQCFTALWEYYKHWDKIIISSHHIPSLIRLPCRILESLQSVLGSVPLLENSTIVQDNFVSFLEDMLPGQQLVTFDFGPVEEILASSRRVITMQPLDNATAFVQIQNMTCDASSESLRMYYTAFLRDTFFLTNETCIEEAIGSLIVAVGVNATNYGSDCISLFLQFQKNEEVTPSHLAQELHGNCCVIIKNTVFFHLPSPTCRLVMEILRVLLSDSVPYLIWVSQEIHSC